MTMELKDLRKQLAKLGFKVRTEKRTFCRVVIYLLDAESMPTIFSKQSLERWQPLIDYLTQSKANGYDSLADNGERIIGHRLND